MRTADSRRLIQCSCFSSAPLLLCCAGGDPAYSSRCLRARTTPRSVLGFISVVDPVAVVAAANGDLLIGSNTKDVPPVVLVRRWRPSFAAGATGTAGAGAVAGAFVVDYRAGGFGGHAAGIAVRGLKNQLRTHARAKRRGGRPCGPLAQLAARISSHARPFHTTTITTRRSPPTGRSCSRWGRTAARCCSSTPRRAPSPERCAGGKKMGCSSTL